MQTEVQSQPVTKYSDLTPKQQERYHSISNIYGEDALVIVQSVNGKGKNSWPTFLEKMEQVLKASAAIREYYEHLYDSFTIGEIYTSAEIIAKVAEVRRDLELLPYRERIKALSEQDFIKIFIVEEIYEVSESGTVVKKVFKGYKPCIRIKPE